MQKLKLSPCVQRRPIVPLPRRQIEVCGQPHSPDALALGKVPLYSLTRRLRGPRSCCGLLETKKSFVEEIRTPDHAAQNVVIFPANFWATFTPLPQVEYFICAKLKEQLGYLQQKASTLSHCALNLITLDPMYLGKQVQKFLRDLPHSGSFSMLVCI